MKDPLEAAVTDVFQAIIILGFGLAVLKKIWDLSRYTVRGVCSVLRCLFMKRIDSLFAGDGIVPPPNPGGPGEPDTPPTPPPPPPAEEG